MGLLLTGGSVYMDGAFQKADICVDAGRIVSISPELPHEGHRVVSVPQCFLLPGFVDVHVHLREPGFCHKETVATGTLAAAAGGYTAVCSMPNLKPVPDSVEHLQEQLTAIEKDALVHVYPYGAITCGQKGEEMADLDGMAANVAGFSDDGRGVQSADMMRRAMVKAKALGKPIVAHCEDESLLAKGWAIHDGVFAKEHGLIGNDPASEWKQVERDIELVRETGCQYHICHVSTKETVALVRKAKAEGLSVTCETGPHYLLLTDEDLQDDGRFRMNPPIRSKEDRAALIEGLLDGTVDCIATDHAPHSAEEKSRGLAGSLNGIVGLECAFAALYTGLIKPGIVPMETVVNALTVNPRKIFGFEGGVLTEGTPADLTVFDPTLSYTVDPGQFRSMGHATPFAGDKMDGKIVMSVCGGEIVFQEGQA